MQSKHPQSLHKYFAILSLVVFSTILAGTEFGSGKTDPAHHMGQVVDWTTRHVHYPQGASLPALVLSERDPRAYWNYLKLSGAARNERDPRNGGGNRPPQHLLHRHPHVDWSINLGAAGTAANMYPAKFSFDVNATPDCTNDYVVFDVNSAPSATQANIVAFNNLYSGSTGGTGICGAGSASTYWAYEVSNVALPTSPTLSLDGKKVAFVDGAATAVFHVLTWTANQGTITAPATPAAAQIVNLTLTGATTDTNSSPFPDYFKDIMYVGTDNGLLFKITGVFKGTPALAGAPWPLTVAAGVKLTGPVIDFKTGNVFVGGTDGNLYGFTSAGAAITGSPLSVGKGGPHGQIADPPVEDVVNGFLYEQTGFGSSTISALVNAIVIQTGTANFSTVQVAAVGNKDQTVLHSGTFNDAYFSTSTNSGAGQGQWFYYVCGVAPPSGKTPTLYRVGFSGTRVMNATVDATSVNLSANNLEQCSPLTELKNGVDRIFVGLLTSAVVEFFDISTNATPTQSAQVSEAGGTSAIIIDNVSGSAQASSIYFSTINTQACGTGGTGRCAVKLTQSGLQ